MDHHYVASITTALEPPQKGKWHLSLFVSLSLSLCEDVIHCTVFFLRSGLEFTAGLFSPLSLFWLLAFVFIRVGPLGWIRKSVFWLWEMLPCVSEAVSKGCTLKRGKPRCLWLPQAQWSWANRPLRNPFYFLPNSVSFFCKNLCFFRFILPSFVFITFVIIKSYVQSKFDTGYFSFTHILYLSRWLTYFVIG